MDLNSPCDGCRHHYSKSLPPSIPVISGGKVVLERRSGMVPAIDGNSNQLTISVWIDHLSNWVESAAASASVHSGVSIEASVCGREEHVEPEYGASAVLSVEGSAALNLGVQALNRGAREKIAEP